jgi:transcriptional regulator with XRE-family HTH domain
MIEASLLRKARKSAKMSQEYLAELLEVSQSHVSILEKGHFQPSAKVEQKLRGIFPHQLDDPDSRSKLLLQIHQDLNQVDTDFLVWLDKTLQLIKR